MRPMLNRKDFCFEICANSVESCIAAQDGGADRVELCAGIPEGGTTPSYGEIKTARKVLQHTRLHIIIRPRGGDFLYSKLELERMVEDIKISKKLGADGVVFGCLKADGNIDIEACHMLMEHTKGLNVTFHRAFDQCQEPEKALEQLVELGFTRILTSGQMATAAEGVNLLNRLNLQADGRIAILAGCGINEKNIRNIFENTQIHEFHFSARIGIKSKMLYRNPQVYMGNKEADEETLYETSAERVEKTIAALLK